MTTPSVQPAASSKPNFASGGIAAYRYHATKVIQLVRHGIGYHNDLPDPTMYMDWKYYDAHLTQQGWAQAHAAGEHFKKNSLEVQLIVSSPLTRCLETAAGVFGVHPPDSNAVTGNGAGTASGGTESNGATSALSNGVWMNSIEDEDGKCTKHSSIGLPSIPVVAHETCRETLGVHPCDKRQKISEIQQQFPGVDFGLIESDEDKLWKEDVREAPECMLARGRHFAHWLMTRPEKHIAVVSHSGFLYAFFQNFAEGYEVTMAKEMHKHFANCEVRTIVLADHSGQQGSIASDPLHFPGGGHRSTKTW